MNFGRKPSRAVRVDVEARLQRLATGWTPLPVVTPDMAPPIEPMSPLDSGGWTRRSLRAFAMALAVLALIAGWLWWQAQPRPITDITASPTSSASASMTVTGIVVVHVAGGVRHPGLVRLPAGSRVADAIDKAGGARSAKYLDTVNLARVLVDGEQIILGHAATSNGGAVNLNSADAPTLEQLPGVGPVLAQRIVQWRTDHGPFHSVDDLNDVTGVGDALMGQLHSLVTV